MTDRPAPFFVGEHRALDFLNSICAPWGDDIEWLVNGADLLAWLQAAKLLTQADVALLSARYSSTQLDQIARDARRLREEFRGVVRAIVENHETVSLAMLSPFNHLIEADCQYLQAVPNQEESADDDQIVLTWQRRWQRPEQLLSIIAQCMADLLVSPNLSRVKLCQGPTCTLWYVDVSKNQRRRWCTMSVCGNRAKAAAHRARKK